MLDIDVRECETFCHLAQIYNLHDECVVYIPAEPA